MTLRGSCLCGAVTYEGAAEMEFSFICQCRACQLTSGTGHTAAVMYPKDALRLTGELMSWTRPTDSGNEVTTYRCAACGSHIYNAPSAMPDKVMIAAGTLSDPSTFTPARIVHSDDAQPWDTITLPPQNGDQP